MALSKDEVQARLRDWLEAKVEGWSNVRLRPLDVALGSGFSAEIFFVDVEYDDAAGAQSRTLVVRRQPTNFEVVLGSSLELQGRMMAALDRLKLAPVPDWIGMELDPSVLDNPFLVMGRVQGQSATQNPPTITRVAGWQTCPRPSAAQRGRTQSNHSPS
jgi:aminoglycoside phosphotransferase (APT) family kinase protein